MAQQCIFEYCNFGKGYLKITFPAKKNKPTQEVTINLNDYNMVYGVVTDIDSLVLKIKEEAGKAEINSFPSILLLLRCSQTYKTSMYIPIKNSWQAKNLYNKDLKEKSENSTYYIVNNSYKRDAGYTFNTYFMHKDIVESFLKIAKQLGTDVAEALPYGMYLENSNEFTGTVAYFYIRQKACTMILVSDQNLITSYDFEFENEKDIINKFLLVASKYEFEFDRKKITHYGIDSDEPIDLKLGLIKLEEK